MRVANYLCSTLRLNKGSENGRRAAPLTLLMNNHVGEIGLQSVWQIVKPQRPITVKPQRPKIYQSQEAVFV